MAVTAQWIRWPVPEIEVNANGIRLRDSAPKKRNSPYNSESDTSVQCPIDTILASWAGTDELVRADYGTSLTVF